VAKRASAFTRSVKLMSQVHKTTDVCLRSFSDCSDCQGLREMQGSSTTGIGAAWTSYATPWGLQRYISSGNKDSSPPDTMKYNSTFPPYILTRRHIMNSCCCI